MDNELGVAFEFVQLPNGLVMGKYPVTQAQWQLVMGSNPSEFKGPNNPVERVSWDDTQDFCQKLSEITGEFFVLPTSEEWEYACRAGSTTRFSFGDDEGQLGDYAWYWLNSNGITHPVGQKKPNQWGLYDMHGNVWEWTATGRDKGHNVLGGEWFEKLPTQSLRGGGWFNDAVVCSSSGRSRSTPGDSDSDVGFRIMHGGSYIGHGCHSDCKIPSPDETQVSSLGFRLLVGGNWYSSAVFCRSEIRNGRTSGYCNSGVGFRVIRGGSCESFSANCPSAIRGHSATDCGRHRDDVGFRIVKGGSWFDASACSRISSRLRFTPGYRDDLVGFRIVRGGCLSTSAEYCSSDECGNYTPGFTNYGAGFRITKL